MDTESSALSSIFINYRRGDSRVYADMLYTWLSERYGEEQVFKDVDTIEIGLDFDEAIERVVAASDVMLVVIGGDWVTDQSGRRRLEDPEDYVRKEIEAGLARNIRVIPILVESATMPTADDLPDPLMALTRRQAFELNETRLRSDRDELLRRLDRLMGKTVGNGAAARRSVAAPAPSQPVHEEPTPPPVPSPPPVYPPPQHPPAQAATASQAAPAYVATAAPDRTKNLRMWGWILAGGSVIIPFAAIGAIILGGLVISRGEGRRTGAGIGIIVTGIFLGLVGLGIWGSFESAAAY